MCELENLIERAVILTNGSVLQVPLPDAALPTAGVAESASAAPADSGERELIIKILRETRGIIAGPSVPRPGFD